MTLTSTAKSPPSLDSALAAFKAGVIENPWQEGTTKKILGSLSKVAKVYQILAPHIPTGSILCDAEELAALFKPYLKSRTFPENCGFKNYDSSYTWHSNVSRFYKLANGQRALKKSLLTREDLWASLLQYMAVADSGSPIMSAKKMIPLVSFIGLCRENSIAPTELLRETVIKLIESSTVKRARTFRDAAKLLDELRESGMISLDLLPPEKIGDLSDYLAEGQWKTPPLHKDYSAEVDRYIEERRHGAKVARLGTTKIVIDTNEGVGISRQKGIRTSLAWFHHGLVAAGLVDEGKPFPWPQIADPALLKTIVDFDVNGAMHRQANGKTRGKRVKDVVRFLDTVFQGYAVSVDDTFFSYRALNNPPNYQTRKKAWKQKTTLEFVDSIALQQAFYGMPQRFYLEAKGLIDRWDDLEQGNNKKAQGRALDLALAAVHLAITTRFPVRQSTVRKLRISGKNPHVIFPENGAKDVRIFPDGEIIKNSYQFPDGIPLFSSKAFSPTKLLQWYIEKVHPLVLEHRVSAPNRKPELLLCGIDRNALQKKIKRHTTEAGLMLDGHMVRHLAGSILYARGVSLDDIAELLGITVATLEKNYLYINRQKKIQRTIDEVALVYKELGL
ncbi:hypothetical protein [uncultured Cohaesibacter sp.]|uniref:hypothetical protein n=1 Tax=uncultured Cohaesibacter sp. TaxID=1002546 RepID=UPI0029C6CDE6|nr:hypothetical protein [uncultured Cohaesibacter sp.]